MDSNNGKVVNEMSDRSELVISVDVNGTQSGSPVKMTDSGIRNGVKTTDSPFKVVEMGAQNGDSCDNTSKMAETGTQFGGKSDSCMKMEEVLQNGGEGRLEVSKELLGVPRTGHRKSFMEEESAKERLRMSLLKQCSAILKQGEEKYTKESLHRTFQDEVSLVFILICQFRNALFCS